MASSNLCNKMRTATLRLPVNRLHAVRTGAAASSITGFPATIPSSTPAELNLSTPYLQLGHWLFNPASADVGTAGSVPNFGLATSQLQEAKSQGRQGSGDTPAENPRNDVPPIPPEEREQNPEVPPSPDETSATANQSDYSSPGEHPAQDKKNVKPDMDNASEAVKQRAAAGETSTVTFRDPEAAAEMREYLRNSDASLAVRAAPREQQQQQDDGADSVFTAPVETLLETPLQAADKHGDGSTGPASHDDQPPGVDADPNVVPPSDDSKGTDKGGDN
jgi:hypothetical protein